MRLGIALLLAFAVVTLLVGQRVMEPVDLALMAAVKRAVGPELDSVAGVLNYVMAAEVSLAYGCLLTLALWRWGVPWPAAGAPLLFLLSLPPEMVLKFTLDQPVPSGDLYRSTLKYGLFSVPTMQSYPSGHAIRTAFFAVLLGFLAARFLDRRLARFAWIALAGLMALSGWCRVYQGHHWPMDVVGGELFGAALACFAVALLAPHLARLPKEKPRIV
jgi:membrane-associated phospholipid phosphatase